MKYLNTKPGSIEELAANMAKHQNESGYQDMFKKELEKAGKGIGSMTPAEKKAFFNKVDSKYTAKDEATTHTMPDGTVMKGAKHKEEVKEEDAYENDRYIIKNGKATLDNSNTPDKKNHVYADGHKDAEKKAKEKGIKEELDAIFFSAALDEKFTVQITKKDGSTMELGKYNTSHEAQKYADMYGKGAKVVKEESDDVKDKEEVKEGEVPAGLKKYLDKKSSDKKEDITGDKQNQKQRAVGGEKKTFKEVYKKTKKEAMNTTGDATVDNANQNLEPTEKPENDPDVKVAKKKTDVGSKTTGVDTSPEIAYKN
jgi:hypothetical protein